MKRNIFPPGIFTLLTVSTLCLGLLLAVNGVRDAQRSVLAAEALSRSVTDYYAGELALQETIATVDTALLFGEDPAHIPGVRREENRLVAEISLADGRLLLAELTLTGPDSGGRYRLTGYTLLPG